jgi:hypothetical protein
MECSLYVWAGGRGVARVAGAVDQADRRGLHTQHPLDFCWAAGAARDWTVTVQVQRDQQTTGAGVVAGRWG